MTVDGERRLFDLTRGGRFTLLSFGNGALPRERVRELAPFELGEAVMCRVWLGLSHALPTDHAARPVALAR